MIAWAERHFDFRGRRTTFRAETMGGLTTFMTMAYIVALNPIILAGAADVNGQKLDIAQLTAATAAVAAVLTLLMGLFANYPIALAAGLGLNGVVAFQLAPQMSWEAAMGIVVLEGLLILVLVAVGFRERMFNLVPESLRTAIAVGIGAFIAFIGFVDAGFIRRTPDEANSPVPVTFGTGGRLIGWPTLVFVVGLALMIILVSRKTRDGRRRRGGILLGLILTTIFAMIVNWLADVPPAFGPNGEYNPHGWGLNVPQLPDSVVSTPDFGLFGEFSIAGAFEVGFISALVFIITLALADFFDTFGTGTAVGEEAGLLDEQGRLLNAKRFLGIDALGAIVGGAASTSSNTSYIESTAGVAEGARTGFANVITAALFGLAVFAAPLVEVVPYEAASPALVIVGFIMMTHIGKIDWRDYEVAIPAFLAILLMPLTFSITIGIGAAIIAYALLRIANGKLLQTKLMTATALLFVAYFAIEYVERGLGIG